MDRDEEISAAVDLASGGGKKGEALVAILTALRDRIAKLEKALKDKPKK